MKPDLEIDVLLATLNGEKYLAEFLESLHNQVNVRINLLVSDDGSTDRTIQVVKNFSKHFKTVELYAGPQKGPACNFLYLLQKSKAQYLAFADQDDVWRPNHLIDSIERIRSFEHLPTLTYTKVLEFDSYSDHRSVWPTKVPEKFHGFFAENFSRGCTQVFNARLRDLLVTQKPKKLIMHDWWVLLTAMACGQAIYENSIEVEYRIHDSNFLGNKKRKSLSVLLMTKRSEWPPVAQLEEFIAINEFRMKDELRNESINFVKGVKGNLFSRLKYFIFCRHKLRMNFWENLCLRIGLLAYPMFFKSQISPKRRNLRVEESDF